MATYYYINKSVEIDMICPLTTINKRHNFCYMYHFVWADQGEKQGYK